MVKLRKQRRKKKYRHNVNRKRLRNKIYSTGKVACKEIANAWEKTKSVQKNLTEMGLLYDPNKIFKVSETKQKLKSLVTSARTGWKVEPNLTEDTDAPKAYVADNLEREAKAPRERMFRLPKGQVEWITYLMDKYGNDYKAMARDKRNHYQETWKQLRAKIKRFMGIPEQYAEYLEKRGLLDTEGEDETVPFEDENDDSD